MDYSEQTFETIMARCLARVGAGLDKREGSVIYDAVAPLAAELAEFYSLQSAEMDRAFPDTAAGADLTNKAKERGIFRLAATQAVRKGIFTDAEGAAMEIPAGSRFSGGSVNYAAGERLADGAYRLTCETAGEIGNAYTGVLFPIDHIDGLGSATLADVLIHGEDEEDDDTLRARYIASFAGMAFAGNVADYKAKVSALPGVGGVKVYRAWNGGGTVKLVVTTSAGGVPSQELVASVQAAIDPEGYQGEGKGLAPIDHCVTVAGVTGCTVAVSAKLTFQDGYTWAGLASAVEAAIQGYLDEVIAAWADDAASVVRVGHVEARILSVNGVLDAAETKLNGTAANLTLQADQIPILGEVSNVTA